MPSQNDKHRGEPSRREPSPSTGEGADSALDALKKKRAETPPADGTLPLSPPKKQP